MALTGGTLLCRYPWVASALTSPCLVSSEAGEEKEGSFLRERGSLRAYCVLAQTAFSRGWWNQCPEDSGSKGWVSVGV